jgi:formamidopyrimidine-DNA glycosylase
MPELPEVFTITRNLKEILPNSTLKNTEVLEVYRSIPKSEEFELLKNQKVINVDRISKYILIHFENLTLQIHLGMTGRIRFSKEKELFGWDKIRLEFENSHNEKFFINFTDTRKFGKVKIQKNISINTGYEPLLVAIEKIEKTVEKIQKKNSEIKNVLLDQTFISGLGNIYANDTLFHSKINPQTKAKDLTSDQIKKIISSAKYVLEKGIENGGSSLKDKMYSDIYGKYGTYQDNFLIYERKKCIDCDTPIIKIKIKGRTSYYCPHCQPNNI